ncbi:MAG: AEC family transporter [Spirochaetales bacterium]|uniref:AEC family transporter n=1 Tax=Candidatus Thalassospirochaeta sargassi TaxID=3119039 RepID=A0AAJ1MKJ5_9SPIO|nr:AEC family transporter [Spirochaetales bacterium]
MNELIKRIIPVFLLILVGYIIKRKNILSDDGIKTLKTLIVTIFLPASLFFAFLDADMTSKYVLLIAGVFFFCLVLYLIGLILKKTAILDSIYGAEFFTGFEFGMVGIALFSGIFGVKALPVIALIGVGHEFFIWFVYLPLLQSHSDEYKTSFKDILISFAKTPIIISIVISIILNKAGLANAVRENFISGGFVTAIGWVSSVTISVVLLVLGASLKFDHIEIGRSLKFILVRFVVAGAVALAAFLAVDHLIPDLPELFPYAWLTFFLLPPPYIIPIYVPDSHNEENVFLSNTIMLYTLFSLAVFVIVLFIFPPVL